MLFSGEGVFVGGPSNKTSLGAGKMHTILRIFSITLLVLLEYEYLLPKEEERMSIPLLSLWAALLGILFINISPRENFEADLLAGFSCFLDSLFWANLILGILSDWREFQVCRLVWLISGGTMILKLLCGPVQGECILVLIFYGILQEGLFCFFYGRADCHGFFCCALYGMWVTGSNPERLLWLLVEHMLWSFFLLFICALFCGNISRRGNLKSPVAFVPYIALAFCLCLILENPTCAEYLILV